jgi:hypothetical protein
MRNLNGRAPAFQVVFSGTRVSPAELSERPPTAAPPPAALTPPWLTVPSALCTCGWLSSTVRPTAGGPPAAAVDVPVPSRPSPYPAKSVTTSSAPNTAIRKLAGSPVSRLPGAVSFPTVCPPSGSSSAAGCLPGGGVSSVSGIGEIVPAPSTAEITRTAVIDGSRERIDLE